MTKLQFNCSPERNFSAPPALSSKNDGPRKPDTSGITNGEFDGFAARWAASLDAPLKLEGQQVTSGGGCYVCRKAADEHVCTESVFDRSSAASVVGTLNRMFGHAGSTALAVPFRPRYGRWGTWYDLGAWPGGVTHSDFYFRTIINDELQDESEIADTRRVVDQLLELDRTSGVAHNREYARLVFADRLKPREALEVLQDRDRQIRPSASQSTRTQL